VTIPVDGAQHHSGRADGWIRLLPRLALQSSARANRRRHATRHLTRLGTLYLLDTVGVLLGMTLMMLLRPDEGWGHIVRWNAPGAGGVSVLAQYVVAVCAGLFLMNAYKEGDAVQDWGRVFPGAALGLLVLHWPMIWTDGGAVFRSYVPSVAAFGGAIWFVRRVSDWSLHLLWERVAEPSRALFVGTPAEVEFAMQRSPMKGPHALVPVARLDLSVSAGGTGGSADPLETQLQSAIHDHDVDTTLLCSQFDDDALTRIVGTSEAAGCRVISFSRAFSVAKLSPTLTTYDRTPVVELTQPGIRGRDLLLKRAFDVVASSLLIIALSPILLVVALLVKRSSPGPALFRQERVGYGGRRFLIMKFRSMCVDAEQQLESLRDESIYDDARLFKMVRDPRVTPLGRFLRRSSLDELPQLFNVLGGSMSLVGPRPPLPSEVAMYGDQSFLRFDVTPGITGPWQVNGRNAIRNFDDVVAIEADYVNGWTIWRDFSILARTVPVVLKMEGAH
jgi:exopolysaccharide biosynthesis polyprenyl glycosylphosphotransferase